MEVEMGDVILELPDGSSPDQIREAVRKFRSTPAFDDVVDKKSGAPARVRTVVGAAPIKDRLATLRQFYPDSVEYGDDNFVFTDPATGRFTLYNPPGMDFGDVASVAREGAQAIGGSLGAVFGAGGGFVVGAPGGPPGMAAAGAAGAATGAGLGTAAAGSLFDLSMALFGDRIDTRTLGEAAIDTGVDMLGGAVGQRAGELMEAGARSVVGGTRNAAQRLVDAYRQLGVDPTAGAVSGSRAVATIEKGLESASASASVMQEQAERVLAQTKAATDRVASSFGRPLTPEGAGATIKQVAINAAERFGFRQEKLYTEAFDLVGPDTPVPLDSIKTLRADLEARIARAPGSLGPIMNRALGVLRSLEGDAGDVGLPFDALREIRTAIGRDLDSPMLAGATSAENVIMKQVYGALTEDMGAAAKSAGPDAAKKLAVADRYTRRFMTQSAETLDKIAKMDADAAAFRFAMQGAQDGGTGLARLRRNFLPEEWDVVAGSVINRLGMARPGAQDAAGEAFSVSTFLTNWNKLSPEAKKALFGGTRYADLRPDLDRLVQVVGSLKEVEKLTNTSNTARAMFTLMTISSLGAAGGAIIGGAEGSGYGAAGTIGLSIVAPRAAAKLITSPRFVKWLTTPPDTVNGIGPKIGRLLAIAEAEPAIREEIGQYIAALRPAPEPAEAGNGR